MVDPKDISPGPSSFGRKHLSINGTNQSRKLGSAEGADTLETFPTPFREIPSEPNFGVGSSLNPGLSLDRIGQALAAFYDDLVAEGIPEHLALLVRQVKPAAAADNSAPEAEPCSLHPKKSGRLALIVEDEAATRTLAVSLFEPTELDAIGCDSAEAALDILRERGADVALVFADVGLAGAMDGLQLAKAVSTLWPRARMVVTSGREIARPGDLPAHAVFIPKPWRPYDLLAEAERATGESKPFQP